MRMNASSVPVIYLPTVQIHWGATTVLVSMATRGTDSDAKVN